MENKIITKWGIARPNKWGHYQITGGNKKYVGKFLHRLIFEEFYQIKLPSNILIHHEDGNPANNNIYNLVPMTFAEHNTIHHTKYPKKEKPVRKSRNTTGIKNVCKDKSKNSWRFTKEINKKVTVITRKNLRELEEIVKKRGFDWSIINKKKALESYKESDYFNERTDNSNVLR